MFLRIRETEKKVGLDTRFKDKNVSNVLKRWVEKETGINNITLYSLIDYVILVCAVLKRIDFSNIRAKTIIEKYEIENQRLKESVQTNIYNMIVSSSVATKVLGLKTYLAN